MQVKNIIRRMAVFVCIFSFSLSGSLVRAQEELMFATISTETSTTSIAEIVFRGGNTFDVLTSPRQDLTKPEEDVEKTEIQELLLKRPIERPGIFTFIAYWVQTAITLGIPANTIVLIFLIPIIATLIAFVRIVIGLPSLEMLVPIILAFALVAVGITAGMIILGAVVLASFFSRTLLRKVPIMYFPKRSLSHLFLAVAVFASLTIAIVLEVESIRDLSIFPILILTLLGDSIVSVQLRKTVSETILITTVTISLGFTGYILATSVTVRDLIILWPEVILLTIPVNLMLGRYFGLRLSEVIRFRALESYGCK